MFDRLRHVLLRERSHDALDVGPLLANQFAVRFSPRLDEAIHVVLRVLKSDQAIDFLVQVSIARCELIAEHAQYPEVDLVGSVECHSGLISVVLLCSKSYT